MNKRQETHYRKDVLCVCVIAITSRW